MITFRLNITFSLDTTRILFFFKDRRVFYATFLFVFIEAPLNFY